MEISTLLEDRCVWIRLSPRTSGNNLNTFIGTSQHLGQLVQIAKENLKTVVGAGSLEVSLEFMENSIKEQCQDQLEAVCFNSEIIFLQLSLLVR